MTTPTKEHYGDFDRAYDFFNRHLFGGTLPRCLITMQRKNRAYGFFSGNRWRRAGEGPEVITDEIAMNPAHFMHRSTEAVLSTLVHEMAHLWQHHFGKPSRSGYHNAEWAAKMIEVGLMPSTTGEPGGKITGQKCSHYILPNRPYAKAVAKLIAKGVTIPYLDRAVDAGAAKVAKKKRESKTKYSCPECGMNAWAKPDAHIMCGDCEVDLLPS